VAHVLPIGVPVLLVQSNEPVHEVERGVADFAPTAVDGNGVTPT
jgi:hypothetical protein